MYLLGYCFVWPYIYHVDFPPNNKRLGMAPFLTCQKKVVLQVKRKNKRSWRGFEAEREQVSGSDRSIQFQLTEKIVKYWGKKKTCVSIFPFFIFKVLRIQQKYIPPNHLLVEPRLYHNDRSKITLLPWLWQHHGSGSNNFSSISE